LTENQLEIQESKMSKKSFSGSWRGVVGIIKPTYRPGSLEEFIRLLPEGIGIIPKFVGVTEGLEKEFVDGFAVAEKIIAELAEMKVDLIHPEGAPLFVQKGYGRSEEIVRELEEKYSVPIVTTGMVLVEGARALRIKRLLVISSYDDGNSSGRLAKYFSYFSDAGFQVPAAEGFPVAFADIGSVSPYEAYAFARQLFFKYPQSDGICLIGSGWRVLDVVPLLEQDLQISVVCAVAARVWAIQKRLHVRQPVKGRGTLLESMP
jgi:maleate cis-trans isomerase